MSEPRDLREPSARLDFTLADTWVDPHRITDFERNDAQLQSFIMFAAAVAGKNAVVICPKFHRFMAECGHGGTPFERVRRMLRDGNLRANMERVKLGKYDLLTKCYTQLVTWTDLDLRTVTEAELETLHGVSHKTARFFTCHSRKDAKVGVVDTHLLKYLRAVGVPDVPETSSVGRHYARLEAAILAEVERLGMAHADFDQRVWSWYSKGNKGLPELALPAR